MRAIRPSLRSLLVLALVLLASSARAGAEPVTLDFDTLPPAPWENVGSGTSSASGGILTIETSSFNEFFLWPPDGDWHENVDNARGWTLETRLRVDPASTPQCNDRGTVQIWAHDHTVLVIIGFSTNEICLAYPDNVHYPMDTTADFHTYRVEVQGMHVTIAVDGIDRIDHQLSWTGGGTVALAFGDGLGGDYSKSYWDYLSYDTGGDPIAELQELVATGVGPGNALDATLDAALDSLARGDVIAAHNQFEALIQKIEAQRGKKIPDDVADELIALIDEILAGL